MEAQGQAINIDELAKHIVVKIPAGITDEAEIERLTQIRRRNVPVKIIREYLHYDVEGSGFEDSIRVMVAPEFRIYLGGIKMKDVTKSGMRPVEMALYNTYVDRVNEFFGQGVLDQVRELAEELDAVFNQMTDGNTLSVLRPGFFDPSGDVDVPAFNLAPNRMTPISRPNENIFFPDFQINTDRLINAIRLVLEFIERLTAASNFVMGKDFEFQGGSGTATRTAAIVQSAEIRFSRPAERLKDAAARIITRAFDIIQLNIPPGLETRVLGEDGKPIFHSGELTDDGLSGQFDAYINPDPTLGSKQTERELASMLYSLLLQNIIVGTDPVKIYKVTAELLKAHGKDPEEFLGPEPKADDIDSPEDENTLMVQGDFERVRAQITENHVLHIQAHTALLNSPTLQALAQTAPNLVQQIVEFNTQHIQEHQQMLQAMMQLVQQQGGKGGPNQRQQPGSNGTSPAGTQTDPNQGVENAGGPAGVALNQQRQGKVNPASQT